MIELAQYAGNVRVTIGRYDRGMCDPAAVLVDPCDPPRRERIASTLRRFGGGALELAKRQRIRVVSLDARGRYDRASDALARMGVDVDAWPAPPAGLFVVEERTVYLRSLSPMAVAHEFAHALDCALGDGVYLSGRDPRIRSAFAGARRYITPYAASSVDEYFAESMRAYVGVNDPHSLWPRATRERLASLDPAIATILAEIFAALPPATNPRAATP